MIEQKIQLNLIPNSRTVKVRCSQYDDQARKIIIELFNGSVAFTIPNGTTVQIRGTKPSGKGFSYSCTFSGNVITAVITGQMTVVAGSVCCEIILTNGTKTLGTANFILEVEKAAMTAGTIIDSDDFASIIKEEVRACANEKLIELEVDQALDETSEKAISNKAVTAEFNSVKKHFDNFANAIKGELTGAVVFADDVSPVEHSPVVKVKSKNHFNIANYSAEKDYSNGKTICAISADSLVIGRTYTVFSAVPMQWFKISNSATGYSCVGLQNDIEGFTSYTFTHQRNANISEGEPLHIYVNNLSKTAMYDISIMETMGICIVEGSVATEYIPYIDPSTVTVTRCGKNLSKQSHITIKGTVSTNGSIGGFHGGILARNMRVQPGATYVVSMVKPNEVTNPCVFFYNGNLSDASITHTACYTELVIGGRGEQISALKGAVTNNNNFEYMAVTTGNESNYAENTEISISIRNLQIEVGEKATAFETYNSAEYTPASDGTVEGVTSLSPYMTILTDTEGAIVECEYNRDSTKVIEKLFDAVAALGGTV
jgi:hypothetical protein